MIPITFSMRFFTLLLLSLVYSGYARAQNDWVEHTQSAGVVFSVQNVVCEYSAGSPVGYTFIKIQNTTTHAVRVSYQLEAHYQDYCQGCDGSSEYHTETVLQPGQSIFGDCNGIAPFRLEVLVNNPNLGRELHFTHFKITDIHVSPID